MKFSRVAVMMALAFAAQACAQVKNESGAYVWYDGGRPRPLQMDRSLLADFGSQGEAGQQPVVRGNGVRILRQQEQEQAAARALAGGKTSPVFRDSEGGAMRALPGNVIVRLDPAWTEPQLAAWLKENGLVELRRLPMGRNILVVSSPPGLPALALANRLQESGKVVSAQPEWWEQRSAR